MYRPSSFCSLCLRIVFSDGPGVASGFSMLTHPPPRRRPRDRRRGIVYGRTVLTALPFQTAAGDALDDVPLGDDEDDQDWDARYNSPCHDDRVVRGVGTLKDREPRRQGEVAGGEEHVDRPEEVV